jgi:hypothetical protein
VVLEKMEKIRWTYHVSNEGVSQRVKEEMNIIQTIKRRKANWIGHFLHRNSFLTHFIEGKIEEMIDMCGRRRSRCKDV